LRWKNSKIFEKFEYLKFRFLFIYRLQQLLMLDDALIALLKLSEVLCKLALFLDVRWLGRNLKRGLSSYIGSNSSIKYNNVTKLRSLENLLILFHLDITNLLFDISLLLLSLYSLLYNIHFIFIPFDSFLVFDFIRELKI
jgi:hypothetical protein